MKRRAFLGIMGTAVVSWPLVAHAQGERMRRIAIVMPFLPTNAEIQGRVRTFRDELRKRGWANGVNMQFDERWTGDNMDLIRSAAKNVVELNPDAIVAVDNIATTVSVPEPSTLLLLAVGAALVGARHRRHSKPGTSH